MNSEMNVFNPTNIDMSRSTFDYHPTVTGTCNAGLLIPVKSIEVLPGDSIKMDLRTLVKMSTPVYPTMDQLFMDVAFYFVPNKLTLGRRYGTPTLNESNQSWAAFVGAQDNLINMPVPASGITLPRLNIQSTRFQDHSLGDYFGYPVVSSVDLNLKIDALDMLSYFAIWNENYREPNTMNPVTWSFGVDSGSGLIYVNPQSYPEYYKPTGATSYTWTDCVGSVSYNAGFWFPFPVCRFHGYFGSALPWPQRNLSGVELPLGDSAPVKTAATMLVNDATNGMTLLDVVTHTVKGNGSALGVDAAGRVNSSDTSVDLTNGYSLYPGNLYADLSQATAANINALRAAIQQQRWYEHLSRSGNRLDELEYGLFGIRPHDSGDDKPLYLGGKRIPLNIEMVASTQGGSTAGTASGAGSLGTLGAFSHTNDTDHYFYHSFDTWGKLICVMCIRHHDTFSQGLRRSLTRDTREDFYWPTFAHLGEQSILKKELYVTGTSTDDEVFGYQEAWTEYRHDPDQVCGLLRPGKSLAYMTYANDFTAAPSLVRFLNASTMVQNVDKTLAVNAYAAGFQFIYQFTFDYTARRCMPTYSDPGLIDHF